MLIAGVDENGPHLFHCDPSGTLTRYSAKAIGSGSEGAQSELHDQYHKVLALIQTLELESAVKMASKILKSVMEEKISASNIQIATVTAEHGYKLFTEAELTPIIEELN